MQGGLVAMQICVVSSPPPPPLLKPSPQPSPQPHSSTPPESPFDPVGLSETAFPAGEIGAPPPGEEGRGGPRERALEAGKFASEAEALRLYRRIATMVRDVKLPAIESAPLDWAGVAALARKWELNGLADRLEKLAGEAN